MYALVCLDVVVANVSSMFTRSQDVAKPTWSIPHAYRYRNELPSLSLH